MANKFSWKIKDENPSLIDESSLFFDISNDIQSFLQTPKVSITGRKILSQTKIEKSIGKEPENLPKNKIVSRNSSKNCKVSLKNKSGSQSISKKLKKPSNFLVKKELNSHKSSLSYSQPINFKEQNAMPEKEISKKPKKPKNSSKKPPLTVEKLVSQTLKKAKANRIQKEKEEAELKDFFDKRKEELSYQNSQIRMDNLLKFKQKKFKPKNAWKGSGRVLSCDIERRIKEISTKTRTNSADKAKFRLEKLNDDICYCKSLNSTQEIILSKRSDVTKSARSTIKSKNELKKELKELDLLRVKAENIKRLASARKSELISQYESKSNRTSKGSKSKKSHRKSENLTENKLSDIIPDIKIDISPISQTTDTDFPFNSTNYSSMQKQLINEQKSLVNIQSAVRGYLARKNKKLNEDEINKKTQEKIKENFIIDISENTIISKPIIEEKAAVIDDKEISIEIIDDVPKEIIKNEKLPTSITPIKEIQNISSISCENKQKDPEYRKVLKEQLIWQETNLEILDTLRQQELLSLRQLTQRTYNAESLESLLKEVINRTYLKVENILEKSTIDIQSALLEDLSYNEEQELEKELDEELSKTKNELLEAFLYEDEKDFILMPEEDRPKLVANISQVEMPKEKKLKFLENNKSIKTKLNLSKQWSPIQSPESKNIDSIEFPEAIITPKKPDGKPQDLHVVTVTFDSPLYKTPPKFALLPEIPPFNPNKRKQSPEKPIKTEDSLEKNLVKECPMPPPRLVCFEFDKVDSPTNTPDLIPVRPSAPLQGYDSSDDDITPTTPANGFPKSPDKDNNFEQIMIEKVIEEIYLVVFQDLLDFHNKESRAIPLLDLIKVSDLPLPSISSSTEHLTQINNEALCKYLAELFNAIKNSPRDILNSLKSPLKRNPLAMLAKMQDTEIGTFIELEKIPNTSILDLGMYIRIEQNRGEISARANLSPHILHVITESEHIHNRMIFDNVNELLQNYRPYGTNCFPMPWSNTNRYTKYPDVNIENIFKEITSKIVDFSQSGIGTVPKDHMVMSNGMVDEVLLQQDREEKLGVVLAEDILEKDQIWANYEFEETQLKLDLGDIVLEHLLTETIDILNKL
ncbi:unnamed protein product [Blepharisma stoltei]|uniref:DUF4378 domain-containing protein n=1 Tax=Blepharisma stoltei TaxID=1481888 RepID=A0AAU9JYE2_9CILI|nr:unnamed protein product [Blepharisma stoltei]